MFGTIIQGKILKISPAGTTGPGVIVKLAFPNWKTSHYFIDKGEANFLEICVGDVLRGYLSNDLPLLKRSFLDQKISGLHYIANLGQVNVRDKTFTTHHLTVGDVYAEITKYLYSSNPVYKRVDEYYTVAQFKLDTGRTLEGVPTNYWPDEGKKFRCRIGYFTGGYYSPTNIPSIDILEMVDSYPVPSLKKRAAKLITGILMPQ